MVKLFLVFLFFTSSLKAQSLFSSQIPALTSELRALKVEEDLAFEDKFNKMARQLEQLLEREKNICIGELSTEAGVIIAKEHRQVCLRDVKAHYLKALNEVHQLRKKYLTLVHQKQMKELDENYQKIREQFDKNF